MPVFSDEKHKHFDNVVTIAVSCALYVITEWQREIAYKAHIEGRTYDLPFYVARIPSDYYILRDVFVLIQMICFICALLALWYWE